MHQLGRLIQALMDSRGMTQADLARASGLTRQHVSTLLSRGTLTRMPEPKTFAGLAKAFPEVGDLPFITAAAEAIGVPVDRLTVVQPDFSSLSNDALLGILKARLDQKEGSDVGKSAQKSPEGAPLPPHQDGRRGPTPWKRGWTAPEKHDTET